MKGQAICAWRRSAMTIITSLGFRPAFLDFATMTIYPSEFAGRVLAARATLIPGFERNGFFYTRTAAARAMMEWGSARVFAQRPTRAS
jgi:hypothetical protein